MAGLNVPGENDTHEIASTCHLTLADLCWQALKCAKLLDHTDTTSYLAGLGSILLLAQDIRETAIRASEAISICAPQ